MEGGETGELTDDTASATDPHRSRSRDRKDVGGRRRPCHQPGPRWVPATVTRPRFTATFRERTSIIATTGRTTASMRMCGIRDFPRRFRDCDPPDREYSLRCWTGTPVSTIEKRAAIPTTTRSSGPRTPTRSTVGAYRRRSIPNWDPLIVSEGEKSTLPSRTTAPRATPSTRAAAGSPSSRRRAADSGVGQHEEDVVTISAATPSSLRPTPVRVAT